jgi:hypothetical protein
MRAFPKDLAKVVAKRWEHMVMGDYETPPCPPVTKLSELLEISYLAAGAPEEARYPQFNLVALPRGKAVHRDRIESRWPFDEPRLLSVSELQRLAPAVDFKKSAIWVEWDKDGWLIVGLADLGTSWHRARVGLEYRYQHPSCLLVQIEGPSRMRVYQGAFRVAVLTSGRIEGRQDADITLSLHSAVDAGLASMSEHFVRPIIEEAHEFVSFEFIALWNTFAAIANSISLDGHGGTVIIIPAGESTNFTGGRVKYRHDSSALRLSFIHFINARHKLADFVIQHEDGGLLPSVQFSDAELTARDAYADLVETTRFIAGLAGCDGAIVISEDLYLLGFGCEIDAEFQPGTKLLDVNDEYRKETVNLDIEQFGMRHRAAVKLVSHEPRYRALVISQDGPISAIWSAEEKVFIRRNLNLVNMNMSWT